MPDGVRLNRELSIIEVKSYGVVTRDDISNSIRLIQEIQEETGVSKLLVDTTEQEALPDAIEILKFFRFIRVKSKPPCWLTSRRLPPKTWNSSKRWRVTAENWYAFTTIANWHCSGWLNRKPGSPPWPPCVPGLTDRRSGCRY